MAATKLDLDDTSRCPLGRRCATCSAEDDLAVGTAVTPVGVHCVTLFARCAAAGDVRQPSWSGAMMDVLEHCGHLGIDLDEMAAALAAERGEPALRPLPAFLEEVAR